MASSRIPPETDKDRERWAEIAAEAASRAAGLMSQSVTKEEVQLMIETHVEVHVKRTMERIGIDVNGGISEARKDQVFLRGFREVTQQVKRQVFQAVCISLVMFLGAALLFWARGGFK